MSLLSSLMQNTTSATTHRVPMTPPGLETWTLKQNAQDGDLSINLNNAQDNDDKKPTIIEIDKSFSFVPVFAYSNVHGSVDDESVGSVPTLNTNGNLDTYIYHRNADGTAGNTESLGLMARSEIKNQPYSVGQRLFGFLTSVDGKSITKDERFAKYIPDNGLVFVSLQFTAYKYFNMVQQLHLNYDQANQQVADHILTLEAKNKKSPDAKDFKNSINGHVTWSPKYELKELSDTARKRMEEKASDVFETLKAYINQINEKDEFFSELVEYGITMPYAVNRLDEKGIYNKETLAKYLTNNSVEKLTALAVGSSASALTTQEKNDAIMSALSGETTKSSEATVEETTDVDEEDLPF